MFVCMQIIIWAVKTRCGKEEICSASRYRLSYNIETNAVLKSYRRGNGLQNDTESITTDAYGFGRGFHPFMMWQLPCMKTSSKLQAAFMRRCVGKQSDNKITVGRLASAQCRMTCKLLECLMYHFTDNMELATEMFVFEL